MSFRTVAIVLAAALVAGCAGSSKVMLGQARAPAQLCSGLAPVRAASDAALERYLDWYFSLGAEWGRIYHLLQGRPEVFLQQRLEQTLAATPGLQDWLGQVQRHADQQEGPTPALPKKAIERPIEPDDGRDCQHGEQQQPGPPPRQAATDDGKPR